MKKLLLSASAVVLALGASAQLNGTGDGFTYDNTDGGSNCFVNSAPNNGGIMAHGDNFDNGPLYLTAADGIELIGSAENTVGGAPTWFALPAVSGSGETAICSSLNGEAAGVDMSANSSVSVVAQSMNVGDTLIVYLGGEGQWVPNTSTYNDGTGAGILAYCVFTTANADEEFTIDFSSVDNAVWTGWAGKSKIQSIGFSTPNTGSKFNVKKVGIGNGHESVLTPDNVASVNAAGVSVSPNPATDVVNVNLGSATNATVELTDLTGKVVASQAAASGSVALNVSAVPAGLYVVSVRSAAGVSTAKVVVK